MDSLIGKMLGNRYEILEKIGEGGMANVYKAKCHLLNRLVAVKVLKDEYINDEEFNLKFQNEAKSAGSLNQQNIIAIYDVGEDGGYPYIVMEYVDGSNIKDIIHRQGKIDTENVIKYSRQIGLALKEAHENKIIHRDIKSQNIMITKNNVVKVADFGIAKAVTSSTITAVGTIMGSVHYFSPEQARGGYIDDRSDIYSLGIVMYEMVTGKLPFDGDSPVNIALKHIQEEIKFSDDDNIPTEIKEIIRKATQKSPDRRYKNVDALLDDLDYVQNSKTLALGMGFADETYRTQLIEVDDEYQKILFNDVASASENLPKRKKENRQVAKKDQEDEGIKKSTMVMIALGALVAALLVVGGIFAVSGGFFGGKDKIETPSFLGMTVEEATLEAEKFELVIVVSESEQNVNYEPGEITRQNPSEGTKVAKGTEVKVTVSEEKPEEPVQMPKVTGKDITEAEAELRALGLEPISEYKEDVEKENMVISQSPVEGYELEKGSRVKLTVSSGLDQSIVTVPNVVGMDQAAGRAQLSKEKLGSTVSYREDKSKAEGVILSQNPKDGSKVAADSEVSIVVNRYEKPALNTIPIVITLPQDRTSVKVEVIDVNSGAVVYNQTVNPADLGGTLAINVQGEPGQTKEYYVYLDGDRSTVYANPQVEF